MALVFAGICPHPPVIIPEIGQGQAKRVQKTILAMKNLSDNFAKSEPETLIVISPHGLVYPDRMNICGINQLIGKFDQPVTKNNTLYFENDLELARILDETANQRDLETLLYNNSEDCYQLDQGTLVPLYYLTQKIDRPIRLVPITYSFQNRNAHFQFGQIILDVIKNYHRAVAIIASGNLSHRLFPTDPTNKNLVGQKFDGKMIRAIMAKDVEAILEFDEDFLEEAGECGYRSILILLGALSSLKWKPEIISYEGPLGIGYLVADFKLED